MKPQLSLLSIVVADMARSLAFYRQLGLDVPAAADSEPHVEIELPGGLRLAWDTVDVMHSFDRAWTSPTGGSRTSLAFRCDGAAEVDAGYTELTELGYEGHLAPWDAVWGMRYAVVHDPDGNAIDLFAAVGDAS